MSGLRKTIKEWIAVVADIATLISLGGAAAAVAAIGASKYIQQLPTPYLELFLVGVFLAVGGALRYGLLWVPRPRSGSPTGGTGQPVELPSVETGTPAQPEAAAAVPATSARPDESDEPEEHAGDRTVGTAFAAARDRNPDLVRSTLGPWIEGADTAEGRLGRRLFMLRLLQTAGDRSALGQIRQIANENPTSFEAVSNLTGALRYVGEDLAAASELAKRRAGLDNHGTIEAMLEESSIRRNLDDFDSAEAVAKDAFAASNDDSQRARSLEALGRAVLGLKRFVEAFCFLERALELDPDNAKLRFDLAFAYSRHEFGPLAVWHYEVLADANSLHAAALNNAAVALEQLNLPFPAVTRYRKAADLDYSLATANLAYSLIGLGFASDAQLWIDKGRSMRTVHENVAAAAADLAKTQKEQEESLAEVKSRARSIRENITGLIGGSKPELPTGRWQLSTGQIVELVTDGASSRGTVGDDDAKIAIRITAAAPLLELNVKGGKFGFTTGNGHLGWRGPKLIGYISGWPNNGMSAFKMSPLEPVTQQIAAPAPS